MFVYGVLDAVASLFLKSLKVGFALPDLLPALLPDLLATSYTHSGSNCFKNSLSILTALNAYILTAGIWSYFLYYKVIKSSFAACI